MTTQWKRLAGDTGRFAVQISFTADPDEGQGIDPEVGLSWGSFQVWAEGRNLCAHMAQGEKVDSVHWYILPLIEWFAQNWNPILHEERLPLRNRETNAWNSLRDTRFPPAAIETDDERASHWERVWQGWWNRHALRSASEGGLFPDIVFRRHRDSVEISWGSAKSIGMPVDFDFVESSSGVARLAPRDVAEPLHTVMSEACEHLFSLTPNSDRLRALRRALIALPRNNQRQRRLMWLASLGVDEPSVRRGWRRIKRWCSELPEAELLRDAARSPLVIDGSCQAALMFGCVSPNIKREDALQLADTIVSLHSHAPHQETLDSNRDFIPADDSDNPPWFQGYQLAEDFHERLGSEFVSSSHVDIEKVVDKLNISVTELSLSDETIRGVTIAGPQHSPGIAWNSNKPV